MAITRWVAAGLGLAVVGGVVAYAQHRDTEEPAYDVLFKDDDFEVRQYAPVIAAQVTHFGERSRAQRASFRRLAAYIFAQDRPEGGEKIAMTSPVVTQRVDQDAKIAMTAPVIQQEAGQDEWQMRFVMPAQYSMDTLPTPPADITLTQVPARRMAVIRFAGMARDADLIVMEARLAQWINEQGLRSTGGFEYAFYDAPMVPGPLRRNEVMIEIAEA